MSTTIIFILVLAVLIFVHELGHFLLARAFGIRVDSFKIGFGPKIFAWKRGETEYGVNWIPFGGYVKIHGEDPDEENTTGPDAARSFVNKARWKQVIVLVAGVTFNFIFAWLLYIVVFASGVTASSDGFEKYAANMSDSRVMVTSVLPGSPAEAASLKDGDVIRGVVSPSMSDGASQEFGVIDGTGQSIEEIQNAINMSAGKPVLVQYLREGQVKNAILTPIGGLVENKYAVGIAMSEVVDLKLPFFSAVAEGFRYTIGMIRETVIGLYTFLANIFRGEPNFADVAGPIGIAGIVGNAAGLGLTYLLMVTAIISINLGVVNLIPFPALDGGRILFVLIEGLIRRRITPKFTNAVNMVGFALLMLLMVAVTYKDVARLVK